MNDRRQRLWIRFDQEPCFGSRQHYFHFLHGYLLPSLEYSLQQPDIRQIVFMTCGPVMDERLREACRLLGLPGLIAHVDLIPTPWRDSTREMPAPRWDGWLLRRGRPDQDPPPNDPVAPAMQRIRRQFLNAVAANPSEAASGDWLLLRRTAQPDFYRAGGSAEIPNYGTGRRSIVNIDTLAIALRQAGLRVRLYEPGAHSLCDQIRTFAQADGIIGLRGAEFANLIWMRPGSQAIMLATPVAQENYVSWSLANLMGIRFTPLAVDSNHPHVEATMILDALVQVAPESAGVTSKPVSQTDGLWAKRAEPLRAERFHTPQDQHTIDAMRAILADPGAPPERRVGACENLIAYGLIDETEDTLTAYRDSPEFGLHARKVLSMCRYLRTNGILDDLTRWRFEPSGEAESTWSNPNGEIVRFLHRVDGATRLILVFTGGAQRFWLSIDVLHQFLRRQGHHLLYLRDPQRLAYLGGIDGFGADFASSCDGLRALAMTLGAQQISCLGSSLGGYGALRYGLELAVDRVLLFSPITDLSWNGPWDIQNAAIDSLRQRLPEPARDLGALYRGHPAPPDVTLYYGEFNRQDKVQALRFRDVPNARLIELEGLADHVVIPALLAQGRFGDILSDFAPAVTSGS